MFMRKFAKPTKNGVKHECLHAIYLLATVIVLAESLNKIERCNAKQLPNLDLRGKAALVLKCIAWVLFAFASGGYLIGLFLDGAPPVNFREYMLMCAFAVLIVRTRVKEG
jgi:hypothetical protein